MLDPGALLRPQARLEPSGLHDVGDVDRLEIEPDARGHRWHLRRDGDRHATAHLARQLHRRGTADPTARLVAVGVAVEQQVQPRARADLDQTQGPAGVVGHTGQSGEEGRAPADFVGLGRAGGEQALELVAVIEAERAKRRVRVVGTGPHDAGFGRPVGVPASEARAPAVEHEEVDGVQQQVGSQLGVRHHRHQVEQLAVTGHAVAEPGVERQPPHLDVGEVTERRSEPRHVLAVTGAT